MARKPTFETVARVTEVKDTGEQQLRVMSRSQCIEELRTERLGRLAFSVGGQAKIFPVNYLFDGEDVVVRTSHGFKLAEAPMRDVAFEIDAWSKDGSWGWSVVVEGPCFNVTGALDDLSTTVRGLPLKAWAPGERTQWLRIHANRISGREFGCSPD